VIRSAGEIYANVRLLRELQPDAKAFCVKRIELLAPSHDQGAFDCSANDALNQFYDGAARQHIQKGISRTFVLTGSEQRKRFTRVTISVEVVPKDFAETHKKVPSTVPGVRLARLTRR